ncbi:preprotein translocase subunit SecG [Albimonas sp. CAU 1670]|uniref:preprotein translocase subunit SecG n=1 Tax=Albimonas sp. CAU 1670 TaxID=3032599 RepID=UPI0023D9D3AE|nr:preprotein translocase subunit SecG [Albimonas sp. CAU 1670]MDF2232761.1 preprotein translocase subunit SecG [Albimonas sp. CAU 1670]
MENVLLIIHLILAAVLIGLVLLQRSEGGALGIGGGGGGGMVSSRGATTAVAKATWAVAGAFILTSLALTVIAAQNSGERSVLDRIGAPAAGETAPLPDANDELPSDLQKLLSPPAADGGGQGTAPAPNAPIAPPSAD